MKAVLYPRVSSLKQVDNTSLESQEKACREYCAAKGYSIEQVFLERGESAKTADRKELQAALAYIAARGDIDAFVVYRLDRFTRQGADYYELLGRLADAGCKLVSATEQLDHATPAGRFMGGMLALQAQFDNEVRAERSKNGMIELVKCGCWVWAAPTGYQAARLRGRPTLVHDPVVAPLIRRAFDLFAAGGTNQDALRKAAYKWGLTGKNGKMLSRQGIRQLLENPVYAARIRTKLVSGERDGAWEPIVPAGLFDRVQRILDSSDRTGVKKITIRAEFPLKGFLWCACGRKVTAYYVNGRGGKKYAYYECPSCRGRISLEDMTTEFEAVLGWSQLHDLQLDTLEKSVRDELAGSARRANEIEAAQRKNSAKLATEKAKLLDLLLRGTIDEETYADRMKTVRDSMAEMDEATVQADHEFMDLDAAIRMARVICSNPREFWVKSSYDNKVTLIRHWFPDGLLFDAAGKVRNKLKLKAATLSGESIAACHNWYTREDSNL